VKKKRRSKSLARRPGLFDVRRRGVVSAKGVFDGDTFDLAPMAKLG
jgi:hypothetical protein